MRRNGVSDITAAGSSVISVSMMTTCIGTLRLAPFLPADYTPSQPYNAPPLIRLTLNPGDDMMPAWLPDGEIVYTAERIDRADHDRCLAVMPGTGAAVFRYVCRSSTSNDSLDVFLEASATSLG